MYGTEMVADPLMPIISRERIGLLLGIQWITHHSVLLDWFYSQTID
jgi:hypothetical protein